ncbi:MAG: TauD/TfdA family dioxygenase [Psychrosphaera sp.]|nr:TauD/TfdA family dioxygenase [Psychrosphaera sp.]
MSLTLPGPFNLITVTPLTDTSELPLLVTPRNSTGNKSSWADCFDEIKQLVEHSLTTFGGLLFRGFGLDGEHDFNDFVQGFDHDLLSYDYASTPRSKVSKGVYTSTEYPSHQVIPLHNEQAYTLNWPLKIWFHCVTASPIGGETPIADSRLIYQKMDEAVKNKFIEQGLLYVRNYGNGLDLPWQEAFNTTSKTAVEQFCQDNKISYQWKDDGELQTRQVCQAVAKHPTSGEMVWFNQAHLFHISNLEPNIRETLVSIVGEENLPRNVYYGDGSPIDNQTLSHVRQVLDECQVAFAWQSGDILMLDNMLAAHGRNTFEGPRKVVVAMAEPHSQLITQE